MSYSYDLLSHTINLTGKGFNISLTGIEPFGERPAPIDWFSDGTCIPLGQIEDLEVKGCHILNHPPINLFNTLTTLRVTLWTELCIERHLELLYPHPEAGIPCPSLREIDCTFWRPPEPFVRPLLGIAMERWRVGHQLELVCISTREELDRSLEDELREQVKELRFRKYAVK
jgi:hypothetical protein